MWRYFCAFVTEMEFFRTFCIHHTTNWRLSRVVIQGHSKFPMRLCHTLPAQWAQRPLPLTSQPRSRCASLFWSHEQLSTIWWVLSLLPLREISPLGLSVGEARGEVSFERHISARVSCFRSSSCDDSRVSHVPWCSAVELVKAESIFIKTSPWYGWLTHVQQF